jgi:putative transposase
LPEFRSKEMLKPSSNRTHAFNETLLGFKYYAFRQLLAAKCKLLGKTLVVCSEMYTSLTWMCCSKLHLRLGSSRMFRCPSRTVATGLDAI